MKVFWLLPLPFLFNIASFYWHQSLHPSVTELLSLQPTVALSPTCNKWKSVLLINAKSLFATICCKLSMQIVQQAKKSATKQIQIQIHKQRQTLITAKAKVGAAHTTTPTCISYIVVVVVLQQQVSFALACRTTVSLALT